MEKNSVRRFEDLIAWQKARELTREIYKVSGSGAFVKDYGLREQIRRAAVSIMSNIAEGFERWRYSEFHQFLSIAKASCAEARSQLYVALDARHIDQVTFIRLLRQADDVGRIIGALRQAIRKLNSKS